MQGTEFDEARFFLALQQSGARVLVIGRRALVAWGLPVLTADYDLWVHADDIEKINTALQPLDLYPNATPEEARARGRYVLENDEHIDVFVAKSRSTADGVAISFDEVWARRVEQPYINNVTIAVPTIDDLISTKKWGMRDKDIADIRLLEALRDNRVKS